jgi:hypothetical protein
MGLYGRQRDRVVKAWEYSPFSAYPTVEVQASAVENLQSQSWPPMTQVKPPICSCCVLFRHGIWAQNQGKKCQTACKPGSVPLAGRRPFIWDAHCWTPRATDPDDSGVTRPPACAGMPSLFGLAPGGVCHATTVTGRAVRSYRTLSPLPLGPRRAEVAVCSLLHCPWGRPRRALPGTASLWSPDFPPSGFPKSGRPAVWRVLPRPRGRQGQASKNEGPGISP